MAPVKTNRTLSGLVEDWLYPNVISVLQKKDLGNQFAPVVIGIGEFITSLVLCWMKQLFSSPQIPVNFKISDVCQRII